MQHASVLQSVSFR